MATIPGTPGDDTLLGTAAADLILGFDGDDLLDGLAADDTLRGNRGNDRLFGGSGNDILLGGLDDDTLDGGTGDDLLSGSSGNDALIGQDGNDTLIGSTGNDFLDGGGDDDTLNGGSGRDTLLGGAGNDELDGDTQDDFVDGGEGNDRLIGWTGHDTLLGGSGNDTLEGNRGDDSLDGGAGNDTITGGDGNDTITGGPVGGPLINATDNDLLYGGDGDDSLIGAFGSDTLLGGDGDDMLQGGIAGGNVLLGQAGDDRLIGRGGRDTLNGGSGRDTLQGGFGDDDLNGDTGNDLVEGDGGDDLLRGWSGHDSLYGGGDDDTLFGGGGRDTLDGGLGLDLLNGGPDDDLLILSEDLLDTVQGGSGEDTLLLQGTGLLLDLTAIPDDRISGIEIIDLAFAGNTLILDPDEVRNLSDSTNRLVVLGDAGDRVLAGGDWTFQGSGTFHGTPVDKYASGAARLWVESSIETDLSFSRSVLNPADLDGSNGFTIAGIDAGDYSGTAVSWAGDINGDGFADLIVGAPRAYGGPGNPLGFAGESYVVFGRASGFGSVLELSSLDGTNGFLLPGTDDSGDPQFSDKLGYSVSGAGDVNGDGLADLIVGSSGAGSTQNYVVFGRTSGFGPVLDLSSLDGTDGFRLPGTFYSYLGHSVSDAGDVNGDGFDDLIIGGPDLYPGTLSPYPPPSNGRGYVIFGRASGFDPAFDLSTLDGTNGFQLPGIDEEDHAGYSVSGAGDVNGDGFADVIIGAPGAPGGYDSPGESYVVFGKASGFGSLFDLSSLDGANGFLLVGVDALDGSGRAVSGAGDVNGDGFADLIIGAPQADGDPSNTRDGAGESYVIFGRASGFSAVLELSSLDGTNGFLLAGIDGSQSPFDSGDNSGVSVSGAGDVNGDGLDDLIIGADRAEAGGESYLVFGRASGFGSLLQLGALAADEGFLIPGIDAGDGSGHSVSGAGDVNGDGFADLIVGAPAANGGPDNAALAAGESHVIFGGDFTGAVDQQGTDANDTLTGDANANVLIGGRGNDTLIGNGGADVLYGAQGDDVLAISDAALQRLNGGTGFDTLRLDGPGFALDLTLIADLKVEEIEQIDLQEGAGAHSLTLNVLEVLNLSDTSNTLRVLGDAADTVDIGAGWTAQAPAGDFAVFTQGAATLEIDADIVVTA